jgi:acyl carrier protein
MRCSPFEQLPEEIAVLHMEDENMRQDAVRTEILEKFSQIVAKSLHIDVAAVTEDSCLDELGAESLDLIEITMEAEDAFNIWISEKSILQTANEVFGPNVLEQDGFLTDAGRALLLDRMPEVDAASLEGQVAVKDLTKYFLRVSAWVRMIESLIAHTPVVCPHCGGVLDHAVAFRMKCKQCEVETALVSGEDLNQKWVRDFQERYCLSAGVSTDAVAT